MVGGVGEFGGIVEIEEVVLMGESRRGGNGVAEPDSKSLDLSIRIAGSIGSWSCFGVQTQVVCGGVQRCTRSCAK